MVTPPLPLPDFRRRWWLLLIALLPFTTVAITRWNEPPAATDGDYAQYLLHAKAIAEGRPYGDIGYIYTNKNFVGPRVQPPGWPLVLAPVVAVVGTHSPFIKLLVTLLVAGFGVVAGLYFLRRGDSLPGVLVAGMVPLALETDYATSSALSDPLFCVLLWMTLHVADDAEPFGWKKGLALALLTAATISVRVAGIALLPALLLFALFRERNVRVKLLLPLVALVAAAAVLVSRRVEWVPFLDRSFNNLSPDGLRRLFSEYRSVPATTTLYPFPWDGVNDGYHLVMLGFIAIGAVRFFRAHFRSALACFAVVYAGVLAFSPVRDPRYAWPLVPLIIYWAVTGALWLGARVVPPREKSFVPRLAAVLFVVVMAGSALHLSRLPKRWSLVADADTIALFEWLRASPDSGMRLVFTNPRVLTLETGVPAMGIPYGAPNQVFDEFRIKRITHVVVPLKHRTRAGEDRLLDIVTDHPERFAKVFANETHDVRRFLAEPAVTPERDQETNPGTP